MALRGDDPNLADKISRILDDLDKQNGEANVESDGDGSDFSETEDNVEIEDELDSSEEIEDNRSGSSLCSDKDDSETVITPSMKNVKGKKSYLWSTVPSKPPNSCTVARNIVHFIPGPTAAAKHIAKPLDSF
ncbi:hypothetical protein C0J52_13908 [Blattella germanica]|nr:hypothetical protein C0J52_13908 [Blattella germanica]